jgi:two-component system NtrC family response regulator
LKELVGQALVYTRYPTALPERTVYREDNDNLHRPTLLELEKEQIRQALVDYKGNRRKAAKALGIGERTLYRKIKEFNL